MTKYYSLTLLFSLFTVTASTQAEDRMDLQGTAIIGNQELPKMLYIVPWKESELPQLSQPPLESLIDEALTPLDREEFRRQVHYFNALSHRPGELK